VKSIIEHLKNYNCAVTISNVLCAAHTLNVKLYRIHLIDDHFHILTTEPIEIFDGNKAIYVKQCIINGRYVENVTFNPMNVLYCAEHIEPNEKGGK